VCVDVVNEVAGDDGDASAGLDLTMRAPPRLR